MTASFAGKIRVFRGQAPVAFTNESVRAVAPLYQIADDTKQVLDPATNLVIQENAAGSWRTVATFVNGRPFAGNIRHYEVDFLGGTFRRGALVNPSNPNIPGTSTPWPARPAASAVRVSGASIPMVSIGGANSFSEDVSRESIDVTDFEADGRRDRIYGLFDVGITVAKFRLEQDGTGRTANLADFIRDQTPLIFEKRSANTRTQNYSITTRNKYDIIRAWMLLDSVSNAGEVPGAETQDLNMMLTRHTGGFIPYQHYAN